MLIGDRQRIGHDDLAGAGAAAFLGATLVPGAEWVAGQVGLEAALARADLVFTGEGRLDAQTAFGKVPVYVARRARARGKPCLALGGSVAPGFNGRALGFSRCAAATPAGVPLETALRDAEIYLARAAATLMMTL